MFASRVIFQRLKTTLLLLALLTIWVSTRPISAGPDVDAPVGGVWWLNNPENEVPSAYYDSILYSEIAPRLREIELNSNRVKVDVIGQSAGGRDLFLVTLSSPENHGRLGQYRALRQTMLKDPEKAQEMLDKKEKFKVPVFINGSIHGNEYPGTDAAIRLIETLAYEDDGDVQMILDNVILLVNVVQNPDGRVMGTRGNAAGFDLNRDFITQTQPETRATVEILTEWNPMVVLDLHGYVTPMLIEPCTPPHNPNYEYDLYLKWAYDEAKAMESELYSWTGLRAQIPFRDFRRGWDDWPPTYTPMYAMYHGAYGHTLETPDRRLGDLTVDAHYAAVWGALKFVAENREAMIHDQIEIFRRGFLDLPQHLIPEELLEETPFEQFNELTVQEFPTAYIIPPGPPYQPSGHQAARLVDFLLFNDVEVEQAGRPFEAGETQYPAGSYVVWMNQPKRGLANTILDSGPDLSEIEGLLFYSPPAVWSHSLLWGARAFAVEGPLVINTHIVTRADKPQGFLQSGQSVAGQTIAYAFVPANLAAYRAIQDMLKEEVDLYRVTETFFDDGRPFKPGTIIIPAEKNLANRLASQYALDLQALTTMPASLTPIRQQKIAVYGDEGVLYALHQLGFDAESISTADLDSGAILNFDLFVNQELSWSWLSSSGKVFLTEFFERGGDYIGLSYRGRGIQFALDAGIAAFAFENAQANAIVELAFDSDEALSAGFGDSDYAFVYDPAWFTTLSDGTSVVARYHGDDFLESGFWPGWNNGRVDNKPAIIQTGVGESDVILFGIDPTFRGHPENTFRLLGNAIYNALD